MKCRRCGNEFEGKFCTKCGLKYEPQTEMINNAQPQVFQNSIVKKKSFFKKWWVWVIIGFVFLFILSALIGGGSETSETTSAGTIVQSEPEKNQETTTTTEPKITESKTTEPKISEDEYKKQCKTLKYEDLARNPEKYKGQKIKIEVEVKQIMNGGLFYQSGYRAYQDYDFDKFDTYLKEEWFVSYELPENSERILEDDIVIFYGEYNGTIEMTRSLTNTKEFIPNIKAEYYTIKKK